MRKDTQENLVVNTPAEGIIVSHLLHPTAHFEHPNDVLSAPQLSEQEKRAILASWASDQYAVEAMPTLRHYPGSSRAVTLAEVLAALRSLDGEVLEERRRRDRGDSPGLLDIRRLAPMRRLRRAVERRT